MSPPASKATYPGVRSGRVRQKPPTPLRSCSRRGLPRRGVLPPARCALPHLFTYRVAVLRRLFSGTFQGSRPPGVTWRLVRRSPDFPPSPRMKAAITRVDSYPPAGYYTRHAATEPPSSPPKPRLFWSRWSPTSWSSSGSASGPPRVHSATDFLGGRGLGLGGWSVVAASTSSPGCCSATPASSTRSACPRCGWCRASGPATVMAVVRPANSR